MEKNKNRSKKKSIEMYRINVLIRQDTADTLDEYVFNNLGSKGEHVDKAIEMYLKANGAYNHGGRIE
jgi:hypothetical protein